MNSSNNRFLENVQRLLIYLKAKGFNISLYELLTRACGINKPPTTHIGRHTFATTVTLANGVR